MRKIIAAALSVTLALNNYGLVYAFEEAAEVVSSDAFSAQEDKLSLCRYALSVTA